MSNSSSSSTAPASLTIPVSKKLTRRTIACGSEKAHVKNLEVEKASKMVTIMNPDYAGWRVRDQHVLTYLVTSLSREVLARVVSNSTSADMWAAITKMFAS
jgi:hypothetical protein